VTTPGELPAVPSWETWAPPLDPPTDGGLDYDVAEQLAKLYWADDPHLCAALQWETYAATLDPAAAGVASVTTGAQRVTYSPPMQGGDFGLAVSRAEWHRSFAAVGSAPLRVAHAIDRGDLI
jgi:hypothetical protein